MGFSFRPAAPVSADRAVRRAGLTTRAAILGLVVCALVVSAALPLREFLGQRGDIARLRQQQAAAQQRVRALEEQQARLQDPAYLAGLARDRLHFVRRGETAYVVLAPQAGEVARPQAAGATSWAAGPQSPWYSQLWGTVRAADRPVQLPAARPAK